jgi:hypothetical protein
MVLPEPEAKKRKFKLRYWYLIVFVAFAVFILLDYFIIH